MWRAVLIFSQMWNIHILVQVHYQIQEQSCPALPLQPKRAKPWCNWGRVICSLQEVERGGNAK